jgi:[ribosomal protein S5]-alanine N-acetyltransferase
MPIPAIETERLVLTIPHPDAARRLLAYATENRDHLTRWEPPHPEGFFTESFWRRRLERNMEEFVRDLSLRLCLVRRAEPDGPILGHCNFSNFVRGGFQACQLGYSLDHRVEGQGYMSEALRAAIAFVFAELDFHRIMANYVPTNERSGRLLRRLGFVVEGYARDYLFIGDGWKDHVLTALTNSAAVLPDGKAKAAWQGLERAGR